MKRIKGFIHNTTTETVAIFVFIIVCLVCIAYWWLFKPNSAWFALLIVVLYFIMQLLVLMTIVNMIRNLVLNRKRYYLDCNRSFFRPKYIWINQCVKIWRPKDKCPRKEFVREMSQISEALPKGTVCYCCTHEDIVKHIKKKFPEAQCTEAYKKDLKKLKKKLKSTNCKSCKSETCPLMQSKDTQFYSVKFIR